MVVELLELLELLESERTIGAGVASSSAGGWESRSQAALFLTLITFTTKDSFARPTLPTTCQQPVVENLTPLGWKPRDP
jgi:hypothetical protein